MRMPKCSLIVAGIWALAWTSSAHATSYLFNVSCQEKQFVAEWDAGAIDPGKEYLRVVTGTKNPGCVISDYNEATDSGLPRDKYSGVSGVVAGLPPVPIICGIFRC